MKQSISYLPQHNQRDLQHLSEAIRARIPQTEMIILFGSYATGKYVAYDERVEFGIPTSYISDYDILVVTHEMDFRTATNVLDNLEQVYYREPDHQSPLQIIHEDIERLNRFISEGRYFYTQLKKEGVMLYNSGKFKLVRRRKLKYDEVKQQAEEYFNDKHKKGESFLDGAGYFFSKSDYVISSFQLHQACENLFGCMRLVFTLQNPKQHNLSKLLARVRRYSPEFLEIFPNNTKEEKRLFDLLKAAYIEARYNPAFVVTKEDIEALIPKVERLLGLVKRICEEQIKEYDQME